MLIIKNSAINILNLNVKLNTYGSGIACGKWMGTFDYPGKQGFCFYEADLIFQQYDRIWPRMVLDAWRGIMNDEERIYKMTEKKPIPNFN